MTVRLQVKVRGCGLGRPHTPVELQEHETNVSHGVPVYSSALRCYQIILLGVVLAIPRWVCAMSTVVGFGHHWGRNGESCVAVDPVARTAGMLAEVV